MHCSLSNVGVCLEYIYLLICFVTEVKKTKEELEDEAAEEEEEAQNIQRRLAKTLSEEDYGLDFIQVSGTYAVVYGGE